MLKLILYGFVVYFLYKVIFEVVVPVSKGVKTVKRNMEQMQRQQAEAFRHAQESAGQASGTSATSGSSAQNAPKKEVQVEAEYIEFEEVKNK